MVLDGFMQVALLLLCQRCKAVMLLRLPRILPKSLRRSRLSSRVGLGFTRHRLGLKLARAWRLRIQDIEA